MLYNKYSDDFEKIRTNKKIYNENINKKNKKDVLKESSDSGKNKKNTCCICGSEFTGYGNNPYPYKEDGRCCSDCNIRYVIPARLKAFRSNKDINES